MTFSQERWVCDACMCAEKEASPALPPVCIFVKSMYNQKGKRASI